MADGPKFVDSVPVSRIFLWLGNPRHEQFDTEAEAIEYLCAHENVHALARDIVKNGLNPLERFALVSISKRRSSSSITSYHVVEGNRRLCALKLLKDPELAPASLRKAFEKLSSAWDNPLSSVAGAVFKDVEAARIWLDRIHNGSQGGIGRKDWSSDQKSRFSGDGKNKSALALLDYAEEQKMITTAERKGKLTTVQRFLGNEIFRETIGFVQTNPDLVGRTRPKEEFDVVTRRFIRDLVGKSAVNSRMNKEDIIRYSRSLSELPGVTNTRVEAEELSSKPATRRKGPRKTPRKLEVAKHIQYEDEIARALKAYGNGKLERLYHSICSVELQPHVLLIAVGCWSFFETLTACAGRNDGVSFESFLSKGRLSQWGFTGDTLSFREAISRTLGYGNTTKHHPVSATFNGDQLNNDMITLKPVILKCIEEAASQPA